MTAIVPLPKSVRTLLRHNTHPGLMLDKFAESWDPDARGDGGLSERVQKPALNAVVRLSQQAPQGLSYEGLVERRAAARQAIGAQVFHCRTTAALTLHLARASALENAGICLHPLYGFVYLPGSGLKGMARAYAETVWFPAQYAADASRKPENDAEIRKATEAWQAIEAVFGWAPNSDARKSWKPHSIPPRGKNEREHAGQIIFHDAWTTTWPKLIVDILNNHHAAYYRGEGAPGDWENPVPVYFLAVEPGQTFEFAVAKRRADVPDALLKQARQWLLGALCHLGAGAKTNAGYGAFQPIEGPRPALVSPRHVTFETTLELVTPAFLAGANQREDDCDLRPATLRGLLRWWWRTMHTGFVDSDTLRAMEAAIWGDTNGGGAVRVEVERLGVKGPFPCPGKKIIPNKKGQPALVPDPDFPKQMGLEPAPKFTTQGLFYNAYGMDEMRTGDVSSRKQRWYLDAGSQWRVRLTARAHSSDNQGNRSTTTSSLNMEPGISLDQARSALWLLCHYGGVGSKCRKGFGSLADPAELSHLSLETVKQESERFRQSWQAKSYPYVKGCGDSLALSHAINITVPTPWADVWFALDQLGATRQSFAQAPASTGHGKHCPSKAFLGLPRRIHGPLPFPLKHQKQYTSPEELRGPKGDRYAAPVFFHFARNPAGELVLRVIAFEPPQLWPHGYFDERSGPTGAKSVLQDLLAHVKQDLSQQAKKLANSGKDTPAPSATVPMRHSSQSAGRVRVTVLGKNQKLNDAYFVQEEGKPRGELRFGKRPADQAPPEPGDVLEVYRHNNDARSPLYRWNPPQSQHGQRRSQGRGGPPRRR
jgi:CRISPR-associated protein Cmr6